MNEFLSQIKKYKSSGPNRLSAEVHREFHFLLASAEKGAYVQTVDKLLHTIEPDYHYHTGEQQNSKIYLADYPYLIFQLIRCRNLLNIKKQPVSVANETATLLLRLEEPENEILPSLHLLFLYRERATHL